MPQLFPKGYNTVMRVALLSIPFLGAGAGITGAAFYRSDYTTGVREVVEQPVQFSHKHHNAQLGIDCRYCHSSVDSSAVAGIPPTKTCMNCHQAMWTGTEILKPIRDSYLNNTPMVWNKVHNVPHYTYFNHSIHLAKGVGCSSCHGAIDDMNLVFQSKTLLMEWCLDCHRAPERNLRPRSEVTNMQWNPKLASRPRVPVIKNDKGELKVVVPELLAAHERESIQYVDAASVDLDGTAILPASQGEMGRMLKDKYQVRDKHTLTNCSMCHR
jgi:hypothetical protein